MPIICPAEYSDASSSYSPYFAQFSYELSPFQKHAIQAIVDGNHTLVCAPTGSGKTLPAEFAIRHFVGQGKKVVYTSPIKALSNQKYHEFSRKFPDISIGLCTGDIKTNPTADLMIMTAEILNNALKRGTNQDKDQNTNANLHFQMDIETELAAIIMDEVHYINDESRGHVWEQSIILCPSHVQLIMLSATLDGPEKFAEWIETTNQNTNSTETNSKNKTVVLAQTGTRIVPLTHYAYIPFLESVPKIVKDKSTVAALRNGTDKLIRLQTSNNVFQDAAYQTMADTIKIYDKHEIRVNQKHTLNQLAKFMKGQEDPDVDDCLLPAIVFVLSRKQVEKYAEEITTSVWEFDSKAPYTIANECESILRKLPNWREYVDLPEYKTLVRNLEKGVATHHSGMIPVLREIVEILIGKKMVRLLFATESFAIGLDCPIRTAVFVGISKFDGTGDRLFHSHEYTQMAGRAGRRGIDVVGNVIHLPTMYRSLPTANEFREVLSGTPQKLESKFHIDYSMVLHAIANRTRNMNNASSVVDTVALVDAVDAGIQLAERSMIRGELDKHQAAQNRITQDAKDRYDAKLAALETSLRTPFDVCKNYNTLKSAMPYLVNKKRKETERSLTNLETQWKWIKDDTKLVQSCDDLKDSWAREKQTSDGLGLWLNNQTEMVVKVLETDGFIDSDGKLTAQGWVAAQIAEIHPLVISRCIFLWDQMERFSPVQIVGLLSAFCDMRLPEDSNPCSHKVHNEFLRYRMNEMQKMYDIYGDTERRLQMATGIKYAGALCMDMADVMMDWAELGDDEVACRAYLHGSVVGISIGDFVKATLKICALAKELRAMALNAGFVELAAKLETTDSMLLKYVATTQSLYLF